jgi:hypothetical protein
MIVSRSGYGGGEEKGENALALAYPRAFSWEPSRSFFEKNDFVLLLVSF